MTLQLEREGLRCTAWRCHWYGTEAWSVLPLAMCCTAGLTRCCLQTARAAQPAHAAHAAHAARCTLHAARCTRCTCCTHTLIKCIYVGFFSSKSRRFESFRVVASLFRFDSGSKRKYFVHFPTFFARLRDCGRWGLWDQFQWELLRQSAHTHRINALFSVCARNGISSAASQLGG